MGKPPRFVRVDQARIVIDIKYGAAARSTFANRDIPGQHHSGLQAVDRDRQAGEITL